MATCPICKTKSNNKVIQHIAEVFRKKISLDHLVEKKNYYSLGKDAKLFDEL